MWIRQKLYPLTVWKVIWIFIAISSVISLFVNLGRALSPNNGLGLDIPMAMEIFSANQAQFSIKYPEGWNAIEKPNGNGGDKEIVAVIYPRGRLFPQVFIARHQFDNSNMDEVISWGTLRAMKKKGYSSISLSPLATVKFNGFSHEYTWISRTIFGTDTIHCQDWYVVDGKLGYSLSLCAENKDWSSTGKLFLDMIESFSTS